MATTSFIITSQPIHGVLSEINLTQGIANYIPDENFVGDDSFTYAIFCDNILINTATVTIYVACSPVSGGKITGESVAVIGVNETYSITNLLGYPPYTYFHEVENGDIISGQDTNTIVVNPTSTPMIITTTVSNCQGNSITLIKSIPVKVSCSPTINVNFNCFEPVSITGTLQGVDEEDRVISWTNNSIRFNAQAGIFNYEFTVTDENDKEHTFVLKNINC